MCGIIGGFGKKASCLNKEVLSTSGKLMVYRGPDVTKFYQNDDETFSVLHHRLGIVGLDSRFDQPYSKNDSVLAFNGEIYNFRENSGYLSDTDYLSDTLNKSGPTSLNQMVGMYAGVFFKENKVLIFRDLYGKKPLYISIEDGLTLFSSEIIPLIKLRAKLGYKNNLSTESISSYLIGGSVHGFNTLISEIAEFKSNQFIEFDIQTNKIVNQNIIISQTQTNRNYEKEDFLSVFKKSVEERSIADHPMAFMFSGGIDSLAIACALKGTKTDLTLFTLSSIHNKAEVDLAISAAKKLNMQHMVVDMPESHIENIYSSLLKLDHPTVDSSFLNIVGIMNEISKDFRVCISGDGGDELLGGYAHYNWMRSGFLNINDKYMHAIENILSFYSRQRLTSIALSFFNKSFAAKQFYSRIMTTRKAKSIYINFDDSIREKRDNFYDINSLASSKNFIQNVTESDLKTTMRELILHKVDRASMLSSVEVRSPLLDSRLFEWRNSMIDRGEWRFLDHKMPLRNLINESIGAEFLNLPKTGFGVDLKKICIDLLTITEIKDSLQQLKSIGISTERVYSDINLGGPAVKSIYSLISLAIWFNRVSSDINIEPYE
jgi:asparagine synthase (glutamine-hydrolysing)